MSNINAKSTSEISQINVTSSHTDIAETSTDDSVLTVSGALNLETGTVNVGSNNTTSNKSKSPATKLADTSSAPAPVASQLAPKTEENANATAKLTNEYADNDIKKNVHPTAATNLSAAKVEPKNDAAPIASTLTDIGAADKIETNDVAPKDKVSNADPAPPDTAVSEVSGSTADKKPDTDVIELKDDNIGTTVSAASEVTVWQTLKNTGKNVVNLASYLNPLNIFKGKSSSNFDLTSSEYEEERAIIKEHGGIYKSVQGNCGAENNKNGVKFTLCNDGYLFIFGKGPMASYFGKVYAPWYAYATQIKKVVIANGVTSIGDGAFYGCSKLIEVKIPDSVTSIGKSAFENCSNLTEITIPGSVTSIGKSMFLRCSNLTQITIPSSVKSIGDWAFYGCSNLTEITIPDTVKSIGSGTLGNCAQLKNVNCYAQSDGSFKDVFKLFKNEGKKTKVSTVYVTKGYKGNTFGRVAVTRQLKAEDDLEALISGLKNLDKGKDGLPDLDNEVGEKYKNRIKIAANSINEKGKIEGTHFENAENASDDDIDMLLSLYYKITENKNDIWKNISPDKDSFMYYLKNVVEKKDVVIEDRRIRNFLLNFINDIGPKIVDDEGTLYSTDSQVLFDLGAQNDNDELKMLLNIYYRVNSNVICFLSNLPKNNGMPDLNKADPKLVKYFTPVINLLGEQKKRRLLVNQSPLQGPNF